MKHLAPHPWGFLALLPLLFLGWLSFDLKEELTRLTTVSVFNVGQGDAILIQTPEHKNILIDAGPDENLLYELDRKLGFFNRKIDLFILTHPHRDHFVGALDALQRYPFGAVMLSGVTSQDLLYRDWLRELKERKIPLLFPHHAQDWQIGKGLVLDFLYPLAEQGLIGQQMNSPNNTSLAFLLKKTDGIPLMLFMGDAEIKEEREILFSGQALKSPVLKVGHHGSKSSTSPALLAAASPQIAVISSGKNNRFGHPEAEILERLEEQGVKIYRTDLNGTVQITFN